MKRTLGWAFVVIVTLGGGGLLWLWLAGGSGTPTTELTTPPPEAVGDGVFVIDPTLSLAGFAIDEILRGSPNRVVGTTDQVAGQVTLDPDDLGATSFSPIMINARTFITDSVQRDRAIRGPVILNSASDQFELITFDVTAVEGLGGTASVGESLRFVITGDLTIRDVTREVAFDVEATLADEVTIEGSATARVTRDEFGIGIPNVPFVADVSDEVEITLDFVAVSA